MSERSSMFTHSDIRTAAEEFVTTALKALDIIWEPEEIETAAEHLTTQAFAWRDESR